jgi:hypothetical protein
MVMGPFDQLDPTSQASSPDSGVGSLPRDPNTGVPIVSIGPSPSATSNVPSQGDGGQAIGNGPSVPPPPTQVAQNDDNAPPSLEDLDQFQNGGGGGGGTQATPQAQSPDQAPPSLDDLNNIQSNIIHGQMGTTSGMGHVIDLAAGINQKLGDLLNPLMIGAESGAASEAGGELAMTGQEKAGEELSKVGQEIINDPSQVQGQEQKLFSALGLQHYYNNTYMNEAGKDALPYLVSIAGVGMAASKMAATAVNTALPSIVGGAQKAIQMYGETITKNPMLWLTHEIVGAVGADVGTRKGQDYAANQELGKGGQAASELLGGVGGAMVSGGMLDVSSKLATSAIPRLIARVGLAPARWLAEGIDEAMDFIGKKASWSKDEDGMYTTQGGQKMYSPLGPTVKSIAAKGSPSLPPVDPFDLEAARANETAARNASDKVTEARLYRDKFPEGSKEWKLGDDALRDAKVRETRAHNLSDTSWNKLPKAVRGTYSREQQALRAKFAATEYPQKFAKDQVVQENAMIQARVDGALNSLEPQDVFGTGEASAAVRSNLWKARDVGKGRLDKFWSRTPLKKRMPNRAILNDINAYILARSKEVPQRFLPSKAVDEVRAAFWGDVDSPIPTVKKLPNLEWVKNFTTGLQQDANAAYRAGDHLTGASYDQLNSVVYKTIGAAFPDNIALQQARDASTEYFDTFARSDVGPLMKINKERGEAIHEEDTMATLLKNTRGMKDVATIVTYLKGKGVLNIKAPDYASKADKALADSLQKTTEDGIRASVRDSVSKVERDPAKVQKMLDSPDFRNKIAPFVKVASQVKAASQSLAKAISQREALEASALAKYMKGDVDKAFMRVWNSSDPAGDARGLIKGIPGIGGFEQDPMAMDGFKAKTIDKFQEVTQGDPAKMAKLLAGPQGRMIKEVLSSNEWNRLQSIVGRINQEMQNRAEGAERKHAVTMLTQLMALKLLHYLPHFMHAGEGGQLKEASLVAGFAKEIREGLLHDLSPDKMLSRMISDPAFERSFLMRPAQSAKEASDLVRHLSISSEFERGIFGFYEGWLTHGQGPGVIPDQADDSSPLSWISPSAAQAATPHEVPQSIDDVLNSYNQGKASGADLRKVLNPLGWDLDKNWWRNNTTIPIIDPSGNVHDWHSANPQSYKVAGEVTPFPGKSGPNAGPPPPLQANQAALSSYQGERNDNVVHAPVSVFRSFVNQRQER